MNSSIKKLYYFCPDSALASILTFGIHEGKLPVSLKPPKFMAGFQFLTMNKSFDQPFLRKSSLRQDMTSNRLEISIPDGKLKNLYSWLACANQFVLPEVFQMLNYGNDPENWFFYRGIVRPGWIGEIKAKPIIVRGNVS